MPPGRPPPQAAEQPPPALRGCRPARYLFSLHRLILALAFVMYVPYVLITYFSFCVYGFVKTNNNIFMLLSRPQACASRLSRASSLSDAEARTGSRPRRPWPPSLLCIYIYTYIYIYIYNISIYLSICLSFYIYVYMYIIYVDIRV